MSVRSRLEDLPHNLVIAVAILAIWQVISMFFQPWVVPGLWDIVVATRFVIENPVFDAYQVQILDTFRRLVVGFLMALVMGSVLGTMMGLYTNVEAFLRSWVVLGLAVPSIAVAFALVIMLGITEWVPILTIVIISTPFIMLNMWEGAQDLEFEITQMAEFFGATRIQRFRHVIIPQMLPYLFPSMYWGFVVCWKVLFIAEVFGAGSGVGYMVNYWYLQRRVDLLLGWVVPPVIVVILMQESIRYTEHRLLAWR